MDKTRTKEKMTEAMLASLATAALALVGGLLMRVRCAYSRDREGSCDPRCACTDKPLVDNSEIEIHTVTINEVDLLYVARK